MRWDILSNWKHHLSAMIGLAVGASLFCLITLYKIRRSVGFMQEIVNDYYQESVYNFFIAVATIGFYVMASCIFTNMKTKQKRESFLMLPASNLEKFVSRLLLMLGWTVASLLGALIIADVIQFIFSFFITPGFHQDIILSTIRSSWESLANVTYWERVCVFYSFMLFVHSFFTLGGAFYRKFPVLLTPCTGLAICILFGYICTELTDTGIIHFHISLNGDSMAEYYFAAAFTTIFLALAAFNYWASYKIFCRMQVICNKWINL